MKFLRILQIIISVILISPFTICIETPGILIKDGNFNEKELEIIDFLDKSFRNEEIRIVGSEKYFDTETGIEYTILVAYHGDEAIQLTLNHNNSHIGDMNHIKADKKGYG